MKNTIPSIAIDEFIEEYVPATYDKDGVQVSSSIGGDGREYPDPTPMSPSVPPHLMQADLGIREVVDRIIREERILALLQENDVETEEEANDFDLEDDPLDPLTQYEKVFQPPPAEKKAPPVGGASEVRPSQAVQQGSSAQQSGESGSKDTLKSPAGIDQQAR